MNSETRSHRDLVVWQRSLDFVESIYRITNNFPPDERFGLTSQLRRAAVSIPSNISEGAARASAKEFAQFVSIALGSATEVETQLEIAVRLKFLSEADSPVPELLQVIRMLIRLRQSLIEKQ